ncbi:MAG TPA: LCP family protein [Dehalococcoidia bacterium]|nr:LCP family protein [Dehalococcoidia bacterium]
MGMQTSYPEPGLRFGPSRRRVASVLFALLLLTLGTGYGAFAMVTQVDQLLFPGNEIRVNLIGNAPGLDVKPPDALAANEDRINLLLIGLDRRPGEQAEKDAYRSDTIVVLSIHPEQKKASMISFPRDLWVQIPEGDGEVSEGRINEAYYRGQYYDYEGGGPGLVADTLTHNFGIAVDRYVVLEFEDFVELIDALGGIDIEIPDHVAYLYSTDEVPGHERWFEVGPGRHHFSGDDALAYARYREDSDLYRIQRQQRVIFAAIDRALSLGMLSRAPELWDKYQDAVDTDISAFQVPGYAALLKGISSDQIASYSLGDAVLGFTTAGGASVLRLLPDQAAPILGRAFRPPEVDQENARIALLNATGEPGLAHEFELYLQIQGIEPANMTFGNAPEGWPMGEAAVLYVPGAKNTARFLGEWIEIDDVREATPEEVQLLFGDAQVVAILGDGVQPRLVALPGTENGAAPASSFIGAEAPPQYDPYEPPVEYFEEPDVVILEEEPVAPLPDETEPPVDEGVVEPPVDPGVGTGEGTVEPPPVTEEPPPVEEPPVDPPPPPPDEENPFGGEDDNPFATVPEAADPTLG